MWCSICTTESPRVGERYTASLFGTLLSGGTSASCSGVSFAGFPLFSSAPSAALALCTGSWYTGTSFLGLGSGSIGAGLSCTGCSFACLWDIGHAPTRRFAYLLLGAIRSDKRRTSIRSLFLMRKNTVKSQMRSGNESRDLWGMCRALSYLPVRKADGWDVWGNEVINDVELTT